MRFQGARHRRKSSTSEIAANQDVCILESSVIEFIYDAFTWLALQSLILSHLYSSLDSAISLNALNFQKLRNLSLSMIQSLREALKG
jgi:hypothetical protein